MGSQDPSVESSTKASDDLRDRSHGDGCIVDAGGLEGYMVIQRLLLVVVEETHRRYPGSVVW